MAPRMRLMEVGLPHRCGWRQMCREVWWPWERQTHEQTEGGIEFDPHLRLAWLAVENFSHYDIPVRARWNIIWPVSVKQTIHWLQTSNEDLRQKRVLSECFSLFSLKKKTQMTFIFLFGMICFVLMVHNVLYCFTTWSKSKHLFWLFLFTHGACCICLCVTYISYMD